MHLYTIVTKKEIKYELAPQVAQVFFGSSICSLVDVGS